MNIPMKYEDVVAQLEAALGRESEMVARANQGKLEMDAASGTIDLLEKDLSTWKQKACEAAEREAALREELGSLKKVTSFSDAVSCVFDMLKYAAANTSCKEWDAQLEDLAEDVIEFAPEYKKQWKDICALQQRLAVAEQRAFYLEGLLREAATTCRVNDLIISANYFESALNPAAEGEGS